MQKLKKLESLVTGMKQIEKDLVRLDPDLAAAKADHDTVAESLKIVQQALTNTSKRPPYGGSGVCKSLERERAFLKINQESQSSLSGFNPARDETHPEL